MLLFYEKLGYLVHCSPSCSSSSLCLSHFPHLRFYPPFFSPPISVVFQYYKSEAFRDYPMSAGEIYGISSRLLQVIILVSFIVKSVRILTPISPTSTQSPNPNSSLRRPPFHSSKSSTSSRSPSPILFAVLKYINILPPRYSTPVIHSLLKLYLSSPSFSYSVFCFPHHRHSLFSSFPFSHSLSSPLSPLLYFIPSYNISSYIHLSEFLHSFKSLLYSIFPILHLSFIFYSLFSDHLSILSKHSL